MANTRLKQIAITCLWYAIAIVLGTSLITALWYFFFYWNNTTTTSVGSTNTTKTTSEKNQTSTTGSPQSLSKKMGENKSDDLKEEEQKITENPNISNEPERQESTTSHPSNSQASEPSQKVVKPSSDPNQHSTEAISIDLGLGNQDQAKNKSEDEVKLELYESLIKEFDFYDDSVKNSKDYIEKFENFLKELKKMDFKGNSSKCHRISTCSDELTKILSLIKLDQIIEGYNNLTKSFGSNEQSENYLNEDIIVELLDQKGYFQKFKFYKNHKLEKRKEHCLKEIQKLLIIYSFNGELKEFKNIIEKFESSTQQKTYLNNNIGDIRDMKKALEKMDYHEYEDLKKRKEYFVEKFEELIQKYNKIKLEEAQNLINGFKSCQDQKTYLYDNIKKLRYLSNDLSPLYKDLKIEVREFSKKYDEEIEKLIRKCEEYEKDEVVSLVNKFLKKGESEPFDETTYDTLEKKLESQSYSAGELGNEEIVKMKEYIKDSHRENLQFKKFMKGFNELKSKVDALTSTTKDTEYKNLEGQLTNKLNRIEKVSYSDNDYYFSLMVGSHLIDKIRDTIKKLEAKLQPVDTQQTQPDGSQQPKSDGLE